MIKFSIRTQFILLVISALLLVATLVMAFYGFPEIIESQVNRSVRLEKGTEQYDIFKNLPFPLEYKVYIFNVSNPDGILRGEKPIVKEVGPFVYKQYRHKKIESTDTDGDTITYTQNMTFKFDSQASVPYTEDTLLTVLNPALMALYQIAEPMYLSGIVDRCMENEFASRGMFINAPVGDLLFEGIKFCKNQGTSIPCQLANVVICNISKSKRNVDDVPEDKLLSFSFLNFKRRGPDGIYTVNRGFEDVSKLGNIVEWNRSNQSNYWRPNSECNAIRGGDSTIYPPRLKTSDQFLIFSTDICRTIEVNYMKETNYQDIAGYEYGTHPGTFYGLNPTSANCYCANQTKGLDGKDSCFLDGVVDVGTCFGVPIVLSFPHFLWADHYRKYVTGLSPDEQLHRTYLILEPNTGIPLEGMKRMQLNMVIRPIVGVRHLENISRALLPLTWIEEGMQLNDEYMQKLRDSYFNKVVMIEAIQWTLVAVFASTTALFGGFLIRTKYIKKD